MINWLNFCPKCGSKKLSTISKNSIKCFSCKIIHYLNPKPCVGGLLIKNNKILLSKRKKAPFKNFWDIPGGFIDPGENPTRALKRELKEELGLKIKIIKLLGFYPDIYGNLKGEPTLNIHYICSANQITIKPKDDVIEAKWFNINNLPKKIAFKNGRRALKDLKESLKEK